MTEVEKEELKEVEVKTDITVPTKKPNRNKKVIPEILEVPKEIETISYSKANELTKKKRVLTDKQKENVLNLIALNKERRETKAKEEQDKEEAKVKLEEAKAKVKLVRVLPKRINKKRVKPAKDEVKHESESDDDDEQMPDPELHFKKVYINDDTDGDTTDTITLKKKLNKLSTMNKIIQKTNENKVIVKSVSQSSNNPSSILKNSGFLTF